MEDDFVSKNTHTNMKILIEAPFSLSETTERMIREDLEKLEKTFEKITRAHVYFKLGDGTGDETVLAEVELHVPGPTIFAAHEAEYYMEALKQAIAKARRQLVKYKEVRFSQRQ